MDITFIAPLLNPTQPVSREELIKEVSEGAQGLINSLASIFDLAPPWMDQESPIKYLDPTCILSKAEEVYDYAVEGILPEDGGSDEAYLDLASFCGMTRYSGEFHSDGAVCGLAEKVMAMALIRSRLDHSVFGKCPNSAVLGGSSHFTLFEIAVIAQMHEKSVRNATQPRAADRLETIRVGTRTMVEARAAYAWLERRRSFKVTRFSTKKELRS